MTKFFRWSDVFSVGHEAIDDDHKALMNSVNTLRAEIMNGAGRAQIASCINHLVQYVDEHFAREEALMARSGYPDLAQHKRLHGHLSNTVHAIRIIFDHDPKLIDPVKLLNFLRDWLIHHILEEDMKFAPYIHEEGRPEIMSGVLQPDAEDTAVFGSIEVVDDGETISLTVPANKIATLRKCAQLLSEGGPESIAIEDIAMPVHQMTRDEAMRIARQLLHHVDRSPRRVIW